MLSIDGMGLGLNWQRFLSQTLNPDLAPKPPQNVDGTSNDGPNNGPANPVNPTAAPPIPVQADLGTDPSKPTNAEIGSATALLQSLAAQYRVAPPEITVDNDTTRAVQGVIQDAQTKYDNAQQALQGAQGVLRMTSRDPDSTPDEHKAAVDNYTKARNAANTAQRELDVTTDAGYRILYGEQAKADQYSSDPTNQNIEGSAQQQADAKLAALQKLFPDQTKANPNFIPQQGDCKTPDQVQAYDDWQSATSSATVGQAKYWADVSNANLAYTQFQSYMGDPAYKDAIDTGVGNLNDALAPLQLQVDLPDAPAADQNGNVDMNAVQANVAQAAKIANYSNAAYAASLDAQQVTTLQQKYDVDSACLIGSTPGAAKDDKAALDRATTQANTSGSYMQMLGAQLTVDDLQTKYDTAKSASDDWHTANPKSLDPHPKVDVDLGNASDALAQAKQTASLAHDGFVVAYGQTLAQQYDDAGSQIDAQLAPKVPFVLQNPTPTLSTNPPPTTTTPAPSPGPSPSLSTSLPSASATPNTSSTPAPSTTQTPSSSLSTSAPASSLSTSLPPTTLFTNPSFVLRPPGSNTSVPTTATGQTALDAKKLHVVAGALRAADGRLSNTYNDAAAKFQLANAQTQEGVLKGKLADTQKTYDDWYAHNPTPVRLRMVDGDEIPMPTPLRANPYQGDLDKARSDLQQADANINKLQLLTEMSHQQVLLDQFDASLAENLRNPQSQDDKDAYSKALDGFFRAHQGELSQSLLDQAGATTNKAATIDFGKLTDNEQRNLIGTAIGLAPDVQPSPDAGSPTAPVNDDTVRYTDKDKLDTINKVRGEILKLGGGASTQVNILPLIYSDKTAGMVTSALFKVTDGKGNVQYVDDTSANYDNVGDYLDNNQLASSGTLDLVTGYDGNGHAQFQQKAAHHDNWFDSALNTLTGGKVNLGMMGLGLLMEGAGVLLDATGAGAFAGAALNFTGAAMMDTAIGSSMAKSAIDIGSRWDHNQSINPFTDAGARGDWLNLVPMGAAGAAKFAGSEVFGKTITALTGSAKAARVTTAIVRGTSLATGVGAAGESFVEAGFAFADGNSKQGWEDLKSGFTNVALMGAGGVRDRVVNAAVRVTGRPVIARSAGGDSISIDGQQLQKILSGKEPPQLAHGATRASLDGVDIKVAKDGTLMAGDKVLTYDNMPVRVLDGLNNKDLNNLPRGASVMLGENGELSIVKLTGKTWTEGTKIDSITQTGDRLSFGSDGEIDAPSKLVAKTPTQWQDDLQQQANDNAPPADHAQNAPAEAEAATRASEASNTATATTAASARNAQHTSEAQAARDENQQETRSSDSHVAAQNRRSSDLRAAEDPAVARAPGAPGAGALEEPASAAPRTPVRVIDLTDAEPATRPATLDPAGVSVPRGPSVEALDYGEHTLFIVRNGDDHAAAPPDAAQPRAAGSLPADVAEPIVVIADAADAHVAPELANRWQRPVFAATPEALHTDGTLRADASLTRYMPAPDAPVTGGRVVGTNAQAQHADATAGIAEADTPAPAPDAPAIRRAPPPANDDTVIVLASTKRGATDPENSAALPPQPPARAARALDGAFSAPNRILVLVKPAERSASQAANDARDASRPPPTGDVQAEDHALPPAAHPETTEAPPDPSLAGPGLFPRLQMRFGGAPLPDAVHALAQQSDTLTQQLRLMSDAGWRVSLGKRGGGSRIDPKRRRVTIDGGLRDSGSITYTLAHEAKHAVEAIDGTLDSLDYSGRSRFTRKALEAEARAQINAFEARYEIDLAGGGDIAAKTTLPDALQHEADRWGPSSDYAGTVERLADAFADAPVSGRRGETYQAFYDGIWDKQKRHGGAPRRMPAPHTTESVGDGGTHLPRTLDEQVRWSFAHAEQISPFAQRGRNEPRQMTLKSLDGRTSIGPDDPLTVIHGRTDAAGNLLDAHGRPAQHVDYSIANFLAGSSTGAGSGRALIFAADNGHAGAAWLANTWQRPVYVPDGGTIRSLNAVAGNPAGTREQVQFGHAPTWTRYAPSPRERIDYGELAVDENGLHVAGDPSRRLDAQALIGPFLGAGIEKTVFELGKRNAIGLYDIDPQRPRDSQIDDHHDALNTERSGLDMLRRYGMRTLSIDGPFSVGNRIAILYHPLAELSSRAVSLGALPKRITHESMRQLAAMHEIVERDGLVFDFQGLFDAHGEFYFSDPSTVFRSDEHDDIASTLEEIDSVIDPLKRGIADGSIALAHPETREALPDGAFVQKPSLITRIRMWFGGAPLSDAAYALAGQSSLLAEQMRLLKSDGWQIVLGRAGRGSRTDVDQRRIVIDGGLLSAGTLVYTLAHEAGHAADVSNDRLGLDTSSPGAYVQSTLLAEARAQANAFAVRKQILDTTGIDIAEHAVLPDAIAREADHVMPGDAAGLARLADAFGNAAVSGRNGERYSTFYGRAWDQQQSGNASLRMPAPHTTESSGGTGGARLPRTLDEQVQWSNEHADRVSPFPRRWFGGSAPKLTFSRNGPVSYASGEPLTLVHARTDAAGGLLDAHGRPATPVDYSIDHRHAFGPAQTGNRLVLDGGDARATHGAWLANIWQRTIYVPDSGTVRTIGESHTDRTHRMQFGGPGTWTRYTPSPRERIDPGALAADANGLHVAGDPSRRVDPAELLGPFLGAGTAKAVFELGKRNAIGLFEAGGDKARTMLEHETRGLDQLKALGMRTVTVDGPFTYRGRIAVLYSPLAELGSIDVMNGILPKRVTRESMRQLAAMRALAERHGLSFDFEGLFDAQGNFYFSDPSVLIRHPDPAANRTPGMIDAVIDPLKRGIASGHVELAHPAISETLPDGAFVQKPSLITRIRMWFGGAPLPDAAYALAGQSSLLANQMRLLNPGHWEIVQGRAGAGSKVDAEQRRIVIDGGLRHAGTIVYVLAHEIGHAVDVATNRLDLDTSSPDAYVQSTLLAEARAQANAFAVRKQILEATGIDIAEHAVLPDAIAREADHVMPGDEAGLARLADAFGNAPTSLPGNPVYRALYRAQAEQAMHDGEAGRAGAAPRTMPSMMMWPVPDPSTFMPAAPALTPESRAADWLDAHGKRNLKRIDGTQLADIRDLAQYAGPNAHVLIAKHLDRPADDGTHPQPDFVASLKTDAYSQPGQPEAADPGDTPSHEVRDAVYPGTRPRKRNDSKPPHEARADFDFYVSPVSLDELRQFGGAAKVEDIDTKRVWDAEPSGDVPADEVVKQIDALARAPRYKRPKAAAKAAEALPAGATIFAVDKKTGKVLGYAESEQGGWTYHEKTSVGDASIGAQDLGTAFRRRARGLPDGRRGVVFVPSSLPESAVSRYGGFEPAERALPVAEQKPPPLKLSDRVQRRLGRIQSAGKPPAGATPLAHRWVAPNLLPKSADDVHDFSGANTLHLRRVIDLGQVGPAYFIYVYGTEGALIDTLHKPDGILATRDDKLQWFDDATHFNDAGKPGIDLDKTMIGGGPDGANRHFLVTKLDPAAFDARAKPTQLEAYALKQAELDKQLTKAAAESSAPFGELEKRIATELTAATAQQAILANDPASGAPAASPPAKPKKRTRGKGKNGNPSTPAAPAPAASPALPSGKPFSIKTYQPGLSSATIAEWILRFGKAKVDNWFPEHERVKAFAGRSGEPLDLGANRQVMMADSVMMKALGLPLRLARDVSSMPWHGPLSRPDHAANVLSRHAKGAMTYLSIARAADRHALQAYARAKAEIQDRIALMARGFTLRDNPDEMLALVKRYGGAMPVVSVAVDPHSLAAALGRKHDPAFIRRVRELGNLDNAQFDEANARIDIDGTRRQLELDDLDHLDKWLDAASEGGFVLRLETAPSRALVSAEDQRTLAGTNDAYHDYVRTFDALETWARRNTDKDAPHVMVTFHGWDAVLEPVPGDGHLKLVEAVLDRKELDWVHLGLSYATHGSDFIANQDLTAALARKLVEYELRAPGKLARLHGADALTRVFERVGTQTLANQHQVLFAEVERVGLANGMTPEKLAQLRTKLYEGNTTALMDRARQATIAYAKENYWNTAAAANRAEFRARDAGNRWLSQYGKPDTEPMQLKIAAHANASSTAFWRAVAADPKLAIDDTKPVIVNRDIAAQPSHQRGDPQKAALAQLNALRVHRPSFGKRDWMWSLGFGGTVAGASSLVALNVFNGMNMMSSDALSHANTALFVGARAGRVFGAMHQGAVQSLQSGDPRAVHDVLDRLQRSLAQQLSASVHGYNPARLEQLDLLTNETRVKASHFVEMHRQGLIGFDDAAAQIKELSADLLANMQGMVGGTSLTQLHRGNSRRLLGLVGRGSAIVGYSGTIAVGVHGLMTTPTVAGALTTASAALAATYSGLVYAVSAHRVNADKRSRVVRLIDSTSDFVGVASGVAGTIAQYDKGHYGLAATAATSTAILLGARLNTHFPNATRWVKKYPTALILVPIGIWGFTQLQSLFFGSPSSGSGSSTHKPKPTSSSSSHQPPQTGGTPTTGLAPGATATQPPGTGTTGSTAPAQPSAPPSPAAQPYIVVAGDSLWVIADAHRQSLLDAAHVSRDDQKAMTHDQQDARALNEILQLNPGMASAPNVLHVGQSINIG